MNSITFTWETTGSSGAPRKASETGDADSRTITGITAKSYTVGDLTAGGKYEYNVKAIYTDQTESAVSNTKEVTLTAAATTPELAADETVSISANVGESKTETFNVLGENLTGNVTLSLSGANAGMFTLSTNSITPTDGDVDTDVTVTYAPTAAGSHTATVTITSDGAESVTVTLNGTATAPVVATPELAADETVSISANVGESKTETFNVLGQNLTGNVTLSLSGANAGMFTLSTNSITPTDGDVDTDVTVTYAPTAAGSHTATVTITSDGAESVTVTLNGTATAAPQPSTSTTFRLATSLNDLNGVTDVIIVNKEAAVALSTTQNNNNRGQADVTLSSDKSTATVPADNTTIAVLTLGTTTMNNATVYTFFDSNYSTAGGYLYAASSRSNYLKTQTTLDDNGKAAISIASTGVATITFQGTNTRNLLRYNSSNTIFSCYASGQNDVYIYYRETASSTEPTLSVAPSSIDFGSVYTGSSNTETFTLTGANLTDDIALAVTGDNVFSINPSTISAADAEEGATVTVTYAPAAAGSHTATVTVSSEGADATVTLSGTASLEKAVPVMQPADNDTEVGDTWFTATWTDATPAANVSSYTLYVNKEETTPDQPDEPSTTPIFTETFDRSTVESDGTADVSSSMDEFADNKGWTGSYVYKAPSGVKLGSGNYPGTLTTPVLDLSGSSDNKVTVKFNANYFGSDGSSVIISSGGNTSVTQELSGTATDYIVVVDCTADADQTITFSCTAKKKRFYIYNVEIFKGDVSTPLASGAPRKAVQEEGDANSRTITGIAADTKTYRVNDLTPGATYKYKVKAVYVDENESGWSSEESVTLKTLTPHSLAQMVADNALNVGDSYAITDGDLLVVARSQDGKTIFCKDDNKYAAKVTAATGQIDYMAEYGGDVTLRNDYDQSNWVVLTAADDSEFDIDLVGSYLNGVSGTITALANPAITVTTMPEAGDAATTAYMSEANVFTPTNFEGLTSVVVGDKNFFFMAPKPMEVAIVTWAMWDGEKFVAVPKTDYTRSNGTRSTMNPYNLGGSFTVETGYLTQELSLTANHVYQFPALISAAGSAAPAPALRAPARSATAGGYTIYALDGMTDIGTVQGGTVTGIEGLMQAGKEVKNTAIYNTMGSELPQLQRGVNIVVIEYSDGTKTVNKILR